HSEAREHEQPGPGRTAAGNEGRSARAEPGRSAGAGGLVKHHEQPFDRCRDAAPTRGTTRSARSVSAHALLTFATGKLIHVKRIRQPGNHAQEPASSGDDGRLEAAARAQPFSAYLVRAEYQRFRATEAVEPGCGRTRIHESSRRGRVVLVCLAAISLAAISLAAISLAVVLGRVFPRVEQDVAKREAHGAWSLQGMRVVPVGKEPTLAPKCAIDGASDANRETLYASSQRP